MKDSVRLVIEVNVPGVAEAINAILEDDVVDADSVSAWMASTSMDGLLEHTIIQEMIGEIIGADYD